MSYSYTTTETFTITHARRLAGKVLADMNQCQRLYGRLSDTEIEEYQEELAVMLHGGYVKSYEFGFKAEGKRVVSWYYTPGPAGDLEGGRSGGIYAAADISSASFFNYMDYTSAWYALSEVERNKIRSGHSIRRTSGDPPKDGDGYWDTSRAYVSGGMAVTRKEFRPW